MPIFFFFATTECGRTATKLRSVVGRPLVRDPPRKLQSNTSCASFEAHSSRAFFTTYCRFCPPRRDVAHRWLNPPIDKWHACVKVQERRQYKLDKNTAVVLEGVVRGDVATWITRILSHREDHIDLEALFPSPSL